MENILAENRAQGWADATRCPAGRLSDRIKTIRQAILDKRAIPAPSAEYRSAAAAAYRAPVRKVNTIPPSMLSMRDLRAKAARLAEEIYGDTYRRKLADARLSNRVDDAFAAVRAGRNPFEEKRAKSEHCSAGSLTSSREEHQKANEQHCNRARKICDQRGDNWAARADAHFAAAEAHKAAGENPDRSDYAERCGKAVVACQRAAAVGTDE